MTVLDRAPLPPVTCTVPKTLKAGKPKNIPKSALQTAGGRFVDELGKAAIAKLKAKLGLNTELHTVDVAAGGTALSTSLSQIQGAITVPQGTTNASRVGNSLRVVLYEQSLRAFASATTAFPFKVRFMVVTARTDSPSVSPSPSAILQFPSDIGSPLYSDIAAHGYQVIFDRTAQLSTVASGQSDGIATMNFAWRPREFHMTWTLGDTTGVQANLEAGGIYVFAMYGDVNGAIVGVPNYVLTSRLQFVDN